MLSIKMFLLFLLATPVQFWIGSRFYVGMYKSLKRGYANMDTLIAGGTSVAYFYSVASIVLSMTLKDFEGDDYFETSALLITFVVLGKYLEAVAKGKTSEALHQVWYLRRLFEVLRLMSLLFFLHFSAAGVAG